MSKKALDWLFANAYTYNFDDKSKLVFISDVHRGDGTFFDSLLPNRNVYTYALKYYLKNNFTYVEVGDGDELWKNSSCIDIAYEYEEVFRIMNSFKKNNQIFMIYGNHDIMKKNKKFYQIQKKKLQKYGENYGKEFLNFIDGTTFYEGINFMYTPLKKKFLATHGHQVNITNNELWFINMFLLRYLGKFIYGIGFKDPTTSAKNNIKRSDYDEKLQAWSRETGNMLLCGHSHNSSIPGLSEAPYFNDGCCVLPYAMTSIEIEKGEISLIKWEIDSNEFGGLYVKRKIIVGPIKISNYLLKETKMVI